MEMYTWQVFVHIDVYQLFSRLDIREMQKHDHVHLSIRLHAFAHLLLG